MASLHKPKQPLVAVMGTTGTGKSDLAVELAVRFDGEIINADAMQMYRGLPIITNQLTSEEQRGIPHHLLASIELDKPTWTVADFTRAASSIIQEIRSRNKLPIVVGGTHYYISSLLFEDSLVAVEDQDKAEEAALGQNDRSTEFPILDGPTDLMLKRLQEVDPVMANRWHPDDRRKIRRSLEIYLTTGQRASDIYAEQQRQKEANAPVASWDALMFWVYSQPDILQDRLDKRVDKMVDKGLMGEVQQLHEILRDLTTSGEVVDRTRGIWQSIGFKEMESFLDAKKAGSPAGELQKLQATGLDQIRIATRQYSKYQLRWLRHKTIPTLKKRGVMDHLFLLDSSKAEDFMQDVLQPAVQISSQFLEAQPLPQPKQLSDTAESVLTAFDDDKMVSKPPPQNKYCEVCDMTLTTEDQWQKHINGRKHHRAKKSKARTALIPTDPTSSPQVKARVPQESEVDLSNPF